MPLVFQNETIRAIRVGAVDGVIDGVAVFVWVAAGDGVGGREPVPLAGEDAGAEEVEVGVGAGLGILGVADVVAAVGMGIGGGAGGAEPLAPGIVGVFVRGDPGRVGQRSDVAMAIVMVKAGVPLAILADEPSLRQGGWGQIAGVEAADSFLAFQRFAPRKS